MADCIFCKIVMGQAPCHKIYEDENHLAFLSIFPRLPKIVVHPNYSLLSPQL